MSYCIEVITGRYAGTAALFGAGDVCRVGARAGSEVWVNSDRFVEPSHCVVAASGSGVRVHNLSRSGTYVNGVLADGVALSHGDWVVTGSTVSLFLSSAHSEQDFDTVLTRLARRFDSLSDAPRYYLGKFDDAGLAAELAAMLPPEATSAVFQSRLWLLRIPDSWPALPWFLRAVWGKGLGVFIHSDAPTSAIAAHIRGAYERRADIPFFDPRILRTLLPELVADQAQRAFGPIASFFVESQLPHSAFIFRRAQSKHVDARAIQADLVQFCQVRPRIPQQRDLFEMLRRAPVSATYGELAASFSASPGTFEDQFDFFEKHRLDKQEAQLQLALVRVALGRAFQSSALDQLFSGSTRSPEIALDQYVTLLNETRG